MLNSSFGLVSVTHLPWWHHRGIEHWPGSGCARHHRRATAEVHYMKPEPARFVFRMISLAALNTTSTFCHGCIRGVFY